MEIDPALVERMVALVRRVAGTPRNLIEEGDQARDILVQLDPHDRYAARLLREQGWTNEPTIGSAAVARMIAQAHRDGRQESTR